LDARVRSLQQSLWSHAEALAAADQHSSLYVHFTSNLTAVFQMHNKRIILGAEYRIPFPVWVVLAIVTLVTMFGVGFRFGLVGHRSATASLMLALTFGLVMTLVFDIDQPGKGVIDVSQQPMRELYQRLQGEEGHEIHAISYP
jgi:hypothetical protein